MAQVVFRHGLDGSKAWVIIIPGLFAAAGWMYSIWKVRGIGPIEWYFAAYQVIYLLWPWTFELRFLIPIAPLICLYVWRGIRAIHLAALTNPRAFGFIGLPAGLVLGMSGIRYSGPGRFPDVLIAPLWIVLAACSLRMIQTGRLPASQIEGWLRSPIRSWNVSPWHVCKWATWTVVVVLLITGVIVQTTIAEANVMTPEQAFANDTSLNHMALELKSARWIKSNTPPAAVVMARHLPIVNHYAARRMVWFAPISNPDALMSGIITHRVDYIIVIRHRTPYYLPDDDSCFDPMLAKYSNAFQLVFHDRDVRIFHVERTLHLTLGEKSHYDVES